MFELEPEIKNKNPSEKNLDDIFTDININQSNIDITEVIFDEYGLIEEINKLDDDDEVKVLLQGFLNKHEEVIQFMNQIDEYSPEIEEFKKLLQIDKEKITGLISKNINKEQLLKELKSIIVETSEKYNNIINKVSQTDKGKNKRRLDAAISDFDTHGGNNSSNGTTLDASNLDVYKGQYSIEQVDNAYKKLYEAIEIDNPKKITVARGRVIKALKKHKKEIDKSYSEVECLQEIYELINSENVSIHEIYSILIKKENEKYAIYLLPYINNYNVFKEKFLLLYEEKAVRKKYLYKSSLREELNEQRKLLSERYSKEFLDKKANIFSIVTMFPDAVGISIQQMANSISEVNEAETTRRKNQKSLETIKNAGVVAVTPIIYAGKLFVNNWYAFYTALKGYNQYKAQKLEYERQEKERLQLEADKAKQEHEEAQVKELAKKLEEKNKLMNKIEQEKAEEYAKKQQQLENLRKSAEKANESKEMEGLPESQRILQDAKNLSPKHSPEPEVEAEKQPEKTETRCEDSGFSTTGIPSIDGESYIWMGLQGPIPNINYKTYNYDIMTDDTEYTHKSNAEIISEGIGDFFDEVGDTLGEIKDYFTK